MTEHALSEKLARCDWGMSIEQAVSGRLESYFSSGLQAVLLCNDGTGRSRTVAESLSTDHSIPSVRIEGGLRRITDEEIVMCRGYLFTLLQQAPYLAIILTASEIHYYLNSLNQLRAFRYRDSQAAIASIVKMSK